MAINASHNSLENKENGVRVYEFGPFQLDTGQRTLTRDGVEIRLKPKTLELLQLFVERGNEVISKDQLMEGIWPGAFVEEANLTVHVSQLRKLLAESNGHSLSIETFPKIGYRFTADVRVVEPDSNISQRQNGFELKAEQGDQSSPTVRETPRTGRASRWIAVGLALLVAIAGGALAWRSWSGWLDRTTPTITRVPGTEQSSSIALSPNGEYLAHAVSKSGKRTLMMTHISSGSSVQLLPPDEALYYGMTFSPDNNHLYFIKSGAEFSTLYKIPILGGNVTKILDGVGMRISFSPDGSRFCFVRKLPGDVYSLVTVAADGSNEVEIARRTPPEYYAGRDISWSPDGNLIAVGAGTRGNNPKSQIVGVRTDSGAEIPLTEKRFSGFDGIEWLRDGSGLVAGMFEGPTSTTHVWLVPYPAGEPVRLTNDLENYGSVGVTEDSTTIMAGQFKDNTSVWVVPAEAPDQSSPVRSGKHHKFQWVRWTPDGGFIFGSDAGKNRDVWRMELDGSGDRQLTDGPDANVMPVATADGRYVVFAAFRDNNGLFELWRMNPDGSEQVRLTNGSGAWQPSLTPDGKWVFYTSGKMDGPPMERRVWKVPVDGGTPVLFTELPAYQADVSPDGKFVICWIKSDEKASPKAAIFSIDGAYPLKVLDAPTGNRLDWTPDGKGISYIKTEGDTSNIWTQPIEGGLPRQETNFKSETIRNFDWSHDGRILVSRFHKSRDVMLIRNFR